MSKYLLILDSGHAKDTAGKRAFDNSLYEWDFNNNMQHLIKKRAEAHGITVKLTNPNPQSVSDITLSVRSAYANKLYSDLKKPNTLFISLHANAYGSTWNTARGVEVYHASNASQNSKNAAKYLCDSIYNDVKNIDSNFKNRGVKCQDFTVIYKTITPAVLVEYGFYSNKDDLKILKNNQNELVEATLKGICKYFCINYQEPKKETVTKAPSTSNTYYRVIAGSYTNRTNADKLVTELKNKGYNAFIDIYKK